jgi:hypothetical protein
VEILAALSVGVLILSALTIAIKTFGLWRRSRQVPELLLSMMLFSVTVIGYPVAVACSLIPPAEVVSIHVVYIAEVTGENPRELTKMVGLALFNSTGIAVAYFWTTLESLGSYRRLRLQLRLGLTEAIVANRVLLWGLMTLAAGVAVILNAVAILLGTPLSPPIVAISSGLGLLHAGFLFLAFNPPGWYRIWVERRHALENA